MIGALIGPGGKNIRAIQEDTGVTIDVDDEGNVTVASADAESARIAIGRVEACTATVQIGKIYDGVVSSVRDFVRSSKFFLVKMACAISANSPADTSQALTPFAKLATP